MNIEKPENSCKQLKEIYLKEEFFESVLSGLKTLELRVAFQSFLNINKGDNVILKSGKGESTKIEIVDIRKYHDMDEVLQSEDVSKLAPNTSKEQIKNLASSIFSEADVGKYGLILFDFKKIE